jgi:hypothetical protein
MVDANDAPPPADAELPPPPPTMHEAERESGASGAVLRGVELDPAAAVVRRRAGGDVVICGPDTGANRRLA